jgi:hypothetical protein
MNTFNNILLNIFSGLIASFGAVVRIIRGSSIHVRVIALLLLIGACTALYIYSTHQSDKTFDIEYAQYAALAAQADNAAYIPGAQGNPVRVELDQTLTQVLDQSTPAAARLKLAGDGLGFLNEAESQIADISSTTAKVDVQVAKMQVDALSAVSSSDKARAILALVKTRSSIISDIRAYSYRTDLEISQIFQHLIDAKGALTSAYIIQLNNEIPAVETEFNKRSNLYTDLQNIAQQIDNTYNGTGGPASGSVNR